MIIIEMDGHPTDEALWEFIVEARKKYGLRLISLTQLPDRQVSKLPSFSTLGSEHSARLHAGGIRVETLQTMTLVELWQKLSSNSFKSATLRAVLRWMAFYGLRLRDFDPINLTIAQNSEDFQADYPSLSVRTALLAYRHMLVPEITARLSDEQLLEVRNFGERALRELRQAYGQ